MCEALTKPEGTGDGAIEPPKRESKKPMCAVERAVMVEFDPQALLAHSLTSQDIVTALRSENRNVQAGTTYVGNKQLLVRSYGWVESVDELRFIPVRTQNTVLV